MTGVLIGAFVVALIWAGSSAVSAENRARKGKQIFTLDELDLETVHRTWVKDQFGGTQ